LAATTPEEGELIAALTRSFASLAGLDPAECLRRIESLGVYTAQLWSAGHAGLAARGVTLPVEVFDAFLPEAQRTAQARRGGTAFLIRLRAALKDSRFVPLVGTVAQLLSRAGQAAAPGGVTNAIQAVREIAGYELLAQIGEGAMGLVFKARQKSLDRIIALKLLPSSLARDHDFVVRFHREAQAAASLRHPNIVGVIDTGTDAPTGAHFIAFEYIDGQTLEETLRAREKLPEREALAIARGIADALACAARSGIVHRDVKPGNILIGKDGVAKLVDLGLAKKVGEELTSSLGYIMGTPAYMSPEQALGLELDHRSDLYSLGFTLYRMLTGKPPFIADSQTVMLMMHVERDCPDPRLAERSISEGAARIILKLSARDREARYADAADAVRDLDLVLGGSPGLTSGEVRLATARIAGGVIPDDPPWTLELQPGAIPDAGLGPPVSSDPAEAVLAALERSGDPLRLAEAIADFETALADSGADALASSKAEAALARAFLLRGERVNAELKAHAALEKDPRCRPALEVLVRAARGDADRCRLEVGFAHVRSAVSHGKLDVARSLAEKIREAFPQEPHPHLALAVLARLTLGASGGTEAELVDNLRRAWSLYPSKERGDVTLGGLDGLAADVLCAHGRAVYRGDGTLLKATLEGLDDKSNLVAGALRMAVGVARVALERGGLTLFEQRRLHFAMARGLSGLRRYDAASDEIARATQFNPSEIEQAFFTSEKSFLTYMKHMIESRPGQKTTEARYRCLGALSLVELARARFAVASKERAACTFEIEKVGAGVAYLSAKNPGVRADLRHTAQRLGHKDPFELLAGIEKEMADIAHERATPSARSVPEPDSGSKRGFLAKLKDAAGAAAAGVAGAAKEAQLLLRESQAKARHDAAVKRFAAVFAKDLASLDGVREELLPFAHRAAGLGSALEYHIEEETRARRDLERLAAHV
jgi:hypothetical protein